MTLSAHMGQRTPHRGSGHLWLYPWAALALQLGPLAQVEAQTAPPAPAAPAEAWPTKPSEPEQSPSVSPAVVARQSQRAQPAPGIGTRARLTQEQYESRMLSSTLLVSVGYGTALVTGAVALGNYFAAERVAHWRPGDTWHGYLDVDDNGEIDRVDERVFRTSARAFTVLSGIGCVLGITGSVLLTQTMRDAGIDTQDERPWVRRKPDQPPLRYAAGVSPQGAVLSLQAHF